VKYPDDLESWSVRLPLLTGFIQPVSVSEVGPTAAPAAGLAPSSLPSDPMTPACMGLSNSSPRALHARMRARGWQQMPQQGRGGGGWRA